MNHKPDPMQISKTKKQNRRREELIDFIRTNSRFYEFVNFDGHTFTQLVKIKKAISVFHLQLN